MKSRLYFFLCMTLLSWFFLVSSCATLHQSEQLLSQLQDPSKGVMVAAHRACWQRAPENSIQSIRDCIALGVDIVEIDVRYTRDGHMVLMHDRTVDRMTNGSGRVADLTLAELKELRLKNRDGGEAVLTEYGIPTLREALLAAKGEILVNVDAKKDVFAAVMKEVLSLGMEDQVILKMEVPPDDPRLTSFEFLKRTNFMPKITEGAGILSSLVPQYTDNEPIAFEVKARTEAYLSEGADAINGMNARLWVNTMSESPEKAAGHVDEVALKDPDAHWGRLIELGVNMLQTDEPDTLLKYLKVKDLR